MRYLFTILISFLLIGKTSAQFSFTGNASGLATVMSIQSVSITGGTTIPSFASLDDYFNGVVMSNYVTVTVKSNVSWLVAVQSQSNYFTPQSSSASSNMPASVLSLKSSSSGTYLTMSLIGVNLKTGNKTGSSTSGTSFGVDMKFNPGFNYKGGIYSIALLYTLSAQ